MQLTVDQFLTRHCACKDGRKWAHDNNIQTNDEAWAKLPHDWLIWTATRPGVLTDRELRLFAVFCARQNAHLLTDPRSIEAIDVAERFANGQATNEEMTAARQAAWEAAWAAREAAAWAADRAAREAAAADQDAWLRANTRPNWEGGEYSHEQRCNHCMTVFDESATECPKCGRDDALMCPF